MTLREGARVDGWEARRDAPPGAPPKGLVIVLSIDAFNDEPLEGGCEAPRDGGWEAPRDAGCEEVAGREAGGCDEGRACTEEGG